MYTVRDPYLHEIDPESLRFGDSSGEILVETAGYIPKEVQIGLLVSSGEALQDYRRRMYPEYESQPTDPDWDPTTQVGYDHFDAMNDLITVTRRLSEQERLSRIAAGESVSISPVVGERTVKTKVDGVTAPVGAVAKSAELE